MIAEKVHAMVVLGLANSRMKDYYDVWMLLRTFELDPARLRRAVDATFTRRRTAVPTRVPEGLSDAFAADPGKLTQWQALPLRLAKTRAHRGAKSHRAEVQPVAPLLVHRVNDERLEDAALANVLGEFDHLVVGELGARVRCVLVDL